MTRPIDARAEQRAIELQKAVGGFTLAAIEYTRWPNKLTRGGIAIERARLQQEVRRYFFRTVLAATAKAADESDYKLIRAALGTWSPDDKLYAQESRIA